MRLILSVLAAAIFTAVFPSVGEAQQIDCRVHTTNPACLKHLQQPGNPTECPPGGKYFNIHQSRAGVVTLNVYDENGVQINLPNAQHSEWKEQYDVICIGSDWARRGYIFEWCTEDAASRVWSRQAIQDYFALPSWTHTVVLIRSPYNLPDRPEWLPQVQRRQ